METGCRILALLIKLAFAGAFVYAMLIAEDGWLLCSTMLNMYEYCR